MSVFPPFAALTRPNRITVTRDVPGATSKSGDPITSSTTVYAALPALIDSFIRGASFVSGPIGPNINHATFMFTDGINVTGYAPGAIVNARGQNLVVSANAKGAFPDIRLNDVVTAEDGRSFRVISVLQYYGVSPNLQAELAIGKA